MAFLYLENNYAGISGDLLVSALADLVGVDKMDKFLKNVLDQLPRGDSQLLRFTRKTERTLSGLHLTFDIIHHSDHLHLPKKYPDHHHDSPSAPHYSLLAMKADLTTALSLENFNEKAKTTALLMLD
ncbi:MAG: nickel insertion protein, partial [Promethearchaeota archaeon]